MANDLKYPTLKEVEAALSMKSPHKRFDVLDAFTKRKPPAEAIPLLRIALNDEYHGVVKLAASGLKKLGPLAIEAMPELVEAAQKVDAVTNVPQCYPGCLEAIVAINPHYPNLLLLIRKFSSLDNWVPISASIKALAIIDTEESRQLMQRIVNFWWPDLNKMQRRVVKKVADAAGVATPLDS